MTTVELHPAYVYDCPECGREGFQRSVSVVLDRDDPDDAHAIRRHLGLDPDEDIPADIGIRSQMMPTRVTCRHCGETFGAIDTGADDPPDDEDD